MTPRRLASITPSLTRREMYVLTYLCRGVPTNGIARALGITTHTCRSYLKSVYAKLGVTN